MKKLLLSSVALLGLTAGAMAADLPSRRVAPAPFVAVPVFTWTGFYVGANAGYGFDVGQTTSGAFGFAPGTGVTLSGPLAGSTGTITPAGNQDRSGFVGGGQIGYNYQIGNIVVGIEADAQYADLTTRRSTATGAVFTAGFPAGGAFFPATNNRQGIEWFGTVRGRLGYAMDRALIYGTGGFAYGEGPDECNSTLAAGRCVGQEGIRTGWTAGGGVEYAFTPNMSGKIEALYVNLDRSGSSRFVGDFRSAGGVVTPVFVNGRRARDEEFVVVRAGLNYKFGTW